MGISVEELNNLRIIHIAGTKGKGSTCAFVETILREHGYKTGLYTSPHLIYVTERIKINGESIGESLFTKEFWEVYHVLTKHKKHEFDMPTYFQFLTIMMFNIFLKSSIDVAIIEVGIGGECDCTNIISDPVCVGITLLGLDHISLLGNTIECIAYQKSGIFKENVAAFTVQQVPEAMKVLNKRSLEKNSTLRIIRDISEFEFKRNPPTLGIPTEIQFSNASLAIELANEWIRKSMTNFENTNTNKLDKIYLDNDKTEKALYICKWPGRTQILKGNFIDYYLDGAHTVESMTVCGNWFKSFEKCNRGKKILIFNATGDRDACVLLKILQPLKFDQAYFVPSLVKKCGPVDQVNRNISESEMINRCKGNCEFWGKNAMCSSSLTDVLDEIRNDYYDSKNLNNNTHRIQLLITGSLHLVGAALTILDPTLSMTTNY